MREGKIEQVGTFDDLYYSPANLFVATFIGTPPLNVLPVEITDGQVIMQGGRWTLPASLTTSYPTRQDAYGRAPRRLATEHA